MMNKVSKLMVTVIAVILVGGVLPTTASATTWHKGTPRALRGSWQRSYKQNGVKNMIYLKVTSKSVAEYRTGWATSTMTHVKYHKVGAGTYKLKGTYRNGNLTKKNDHMKIKKSHGKITFKFSWSGRYPYIGWYHK